MQVAQHEVLDNVLVVLGLLDSLELMPVALALPLPSTMDCASAAMMLAVSSSVR